MAMRAWPLPLCAFTLLHILLGAVVSFGGIGGLTEFPTPRYVPRPLGERGALEEPKRLTERRDRRRTSGFRFDELKSTKPNPSQRRKVQIKEESTAIF